MVPPLLLALLLPLAAIDKVFTELGMHCHFSK